MEDLSTFVNSRYEKKIFVNSPQKEDYQLPIEVLVELIYRNTVDPTFSIVMPIYNQENIIVKNIQSIIDHTTQEYYELILILDACSDNSERNVMEWIKTTAFPELLTRIMILKSPTPLFETSADNLGFCVSRGTYLLEIQADMEMTELGYNMELLKPFTRDPTIIGISGRCCHGIKTPGGMGKLSTLVQEKLPEDTDKNAYYVGETCNRGPLLLDHKKVKVLGYLDEINYFLDDSDHDLFTRAFYQKGWICGYKPIEFIAPLENGSTRKPRDVLNETVYQFKKRNRLFKGGFLSTCVFPNPRPITKHSLDIYLPVELDTFSINDVFHNDEHKIVVLCNGIQSHSFFLENENSFERYPCPHGHVTLYVSKIPIPYLNLLKIYATTKDHFFVARVNKYPTFENEIIMSTVVKNEDEYIKQWIEYHTQLGVTRFIIYDNGKNDTKSRFHPGKSKTTNLKETLKKYIQEKTVVLIEWTYPETKKFQQTQQNHSIHAFQRSKYIGLFDVDEYLNPQTDEWNVGTFFDNFIQEKNIDIMNVGSFRLLSKNFYNPEEKPTNGYEFLKIKTCGEIIKYGYEKNFVLPKNIRTHSVHTITSGKPMFLVDPASFYFNHYIFLNKDGRGRDQTKFTDASIQPKVERVNKIS